MEQRDLMGAGQSTADGPRRSMRADARRNRAKVLEVAREVFSTEGTGVPLDDIAAKAGVGAGTVYRHFPTKESLIQAVLLDRVEGLIERARALSEIEPPDRALELFVYEMLSEGEKKRDLIDGLIRIGVDPATWLAEMNARLRRVMGELLDRAQQAGAIRADIDADDLMALVTGVLFALQRNVRRPQVPRRSLEVLLDGLRHRDEGMPGSAEEGMPGSAEEGMPGSAEEGMPGSAEEGMLGSADEGVLGSRD